MAITMQIFNTYIAPSSDSLMDLGASGYQWKDLYDFSLPVLESHIRYQHQK